MERTASITSATVPTLAAIPAAAAVAAVVICSAHYSITGLHGQRVADTTQKQDPQMHQGDRAGVKTVRQAAMQRCRQARTG